MSTTTIPTTITITTPDQAIAFALDHLQPYELAEFLREWREGNNLTPWLEAARDDQS